MTSSVKVILVSAMLAANLTGAEHHYMARPGTIHLRAEESITYDSADGNRWAADAGNLNMYTGDNVMLLFDDCNTAAVEDDIIVAVYDTTTGTVDVLN
jgi:hypothetical protein